MVRSLNTGAILRLALVATATVSMAACAKKPMPITQAPTPAPQAQNTTPPRTQLPPDVSSAPAGPVAGSTQDFVVNVGDRVYFETDSHEINGEATPILAAQANWLKRYSNVQVRIEGNADERGTREYNLALGARRANAVRDFLVSNGVATGRISTISFGKEQPLDPGTDEAAWAKNRNAHTAIVSGAR